MDYPNYNPQFRWADQYLQEFYHQEVANLSYRQNQTVDQIYSIIVTRYPALLQLLVPYRVSPIIIQILTRRIIEFTINNADQVTGPIDRRVNTLYRMFVSENQRLIFALTILGVPANVLENYIKGVIRATLEIIDVTDDLTAEVERLVRLFEQRFPNFLGLTNIYNIPPRIARRIVGDIIEYTLRNINRISPVGTIQSRANQMLLLLDRERPDLIEAMINRGVPAVRAEEITRRIIIFTLRNARIPVR